MNTDSVKTDPGRLTAPVMLGTRDHEQLPLIFCRENRADMGLTVGDIAGAMAIKMAEPEREMICLTGDGTCKMAISELATAAILGSPSPSSRRTTIYSALGMSGREPRGIGSDGSALTEPGKGIKANCISNIAMENEDYANGLLVKEVSSAARPLPRRCSVHVPGLSRAVCSLMTAAPRFGQMPVRSQPARMSHKAFARPGTGFICVKPAPEGVGLQLGHSIAIRRLARAC